MRSEILYCVARWTRWNGDCYVEFLKQLPNAEFPVGVWTFIIDWALTTTSNVEAADWQGYTTRKDACVCPVEDRNSDKRLLRQPVMTSDFANDFGTKVAS